MSRQESSGSGRASYHYNVEGLVFAVSQNGVTTTLSEAELEEQRLKASQPHSIGLTAYRITEEEIEGRREDGLR